MKQWTRQGVIGYFCTPVTQPYHNSKEKISESAKERRKIKNGNKYTLKEKKICTTTNKFTHGCHYILNQTTYTNPIQCVGKSRNTWTKTRKDRTSWFLTRIKIHYQTQ